MSEMIVAVVVHFADPERTEACVRSFLDAGIETIVVDNASSYRDSQPATELIRAGGNLGYGAGANLGLRRAFERAPVALLVNDDVTLRHPEGLAVLAERLERDPSIGVAGPRVEGPDGRPQPTVERWPSLARAVALAFGRRPLTPEREQEVEAVNGVCIAISRAAFEAVGGFDEQYFLSAEELDLCRRLALAGYRTVFVPAPSVVHHHAPGEARGDSVRLIRVNYVRFCRDHRGPSSAWLVALLFLAGACARRREPVALARALGAVLVPERERFVDRTLFPALLAIWVLLLALGSSYDQPLRSVGGAGKFALLFFLIGAEAPRIVRDVRGYLRELQPGALHLAAAALLLFGALSALWSSSSRHTFDYVVGLTLLFAAVLLGPWRIAQSPDGARALARALLLGAAAGVLANAHALLLSPHLALYTVAPGTPRRFRGLLENPDEVGSYAVLAGLALWWALEHARALRAAPRRRRLAAGLGFAIGALFLLELVDSGTRSGILLFCCAGAIFVAGYLGGRDGVLAAAGITLAGGIAAVAILSSPGLRQSLPSFVRPSTLSTLGGRTVAWSASLHLIDQRPLGGFGLGTEDDASSLYRADGLRLFLTCAAMPVAWQEQLPPTGCAALIPAGRRLAGFSGSNSHDSFLGLGVQLGAVAMGAVCLALILAVGRVALLIRARAAFELALLAGIVAGIGWALVETYLFSPGNVITGPFWLLLAIAFAAPARARAER